MESDIASKQSSLLLKRTEKRLILKMKARVKVRTNNDRVQEMKFFE
jgi:hypothetical protein